MTDTLSDLHQRYDGPIPDHLRDEALRQPLADVPPATITVEMVQRLFDAACQAGLWQERYDALCRRPNADADGLAHINGKASAHRMHAVDLLIEMRQIAAGAVAAQLVRVKA